MIWSRPGVGRERPYLGVSALKVFAGDFSRCSMTNRGLPHLVDTSPRPPVTRQDANVSVKASKDLGNTTRKRVHPHSMPGYRHTFLCYLEKKEKVEGDP